MVRKRRSNEAMALGASETTQSQDLSQPSPGRPRRRSAAVAIERLEEMGKPKRARMTQNQRTPKTEITTPKKRRSSQKKLPIPKSDQSAAYDIIDLTSEDTVAREVLAPQEPDGQGKDHLNTLPDELIARIYSLVGTWDKITALKFVSNRSCQLVRKRAAWLSNGLSVRVAFERNPVTGNVVRVFTYVNGRNFTRNWRLRAVRRLLKYFGPVSSVSLDTDFDHGRDVTFVRNLWNCVTDTYSTHRESIPRLFSLTFKGSSAFGKDLSDVIYFCQTSLRRISVTFLPRENHVSNGAAGDDFWSSLSDCNRLTHIYYKFGAMRFDGQTLDALRAKRHSLKELHCPEVNMDTEEAVSLLSDLPHLNSFGLKVYPPDLIPQIVSNNSTGLRIRKLYFHPTSTYHMVSLETLTLAVDNLPKLDTIQVNFSNNSRFDMYRAIWCCLSALQMHTQVHMTLRLRCTAAWNNARFFERVKGRGSRKVQQILPLGQQKYAFVRNDSDMKGGKVYVVVEFLDE